MKLYQFSKDCTLLSFFAGTSLKKGGFSGINVDKNLAP